MPILHSLLWFEDPNRWNCTQQSSCRVSGMCSCPLPRPFPPRVPAVRRVMWRRRSSIGADLSTLQTLQAKFEARLNLCDTQWSRVEGLDSHRIVGSPSGFKDSNNSNICHAMHWDGFSALQELSRAPIFDTRPCQICGSLRDCILRPGFTDENGFNYWININQQGPGLPTGNMLREEESLF